MQAKIDSYWLQRRQRTQGHPDVNLANLSTKPNEPIQAKLTVGAPGDKYEQEADAMASQVMSMSDAAVQREAVGEEQAEEEVRAKPLTAAITPLVQREAMPEEELQAKPLNAPIQRETLPEEEVQAKRSLQFKSDASFQANSNIESQLNNSKGGEVR